MGNKGLTYIELLAAIVISALAFTLVFNIFNMGLKIGEGSKIDVSLQQEANLVATELRNDYLNYSKEDVDNEIGYTLDVQENQIILNERVISNKFKYELIKLIVEDDEDDEDENELFDSFPPPSIEIELEFKSENSSYTLRTTLSRGV